jgi:2Fe-2S ferredoxin
MPIIHVTDRRGARHDVEAPAGERLMEVLRRSGLPVEGLCGGCMACGTCHVYVAPAWTAKLPAPDADETGMLEALGHRQDALSRLSCQIAMAEGLAGLELTLAPEE